MNTSALVEASPTLSPLPLGRVLRAYAMEAKFETLGALRSVGFAVPFIAIPILIYVIFGVLIIPSGGGGGGGDPGADGGFGPGVANYLFSGFAVVGAIMPGIFMGCILATERDGNLHKLKRALPLPPGATIIAKVLMSMGVAAIAVTLVAIAGLLAGELTISVLQVLVIWATLIIGVIPFCAIGLFLGTVSSGSAAPAYGNLVFLPMMWLSGIFIPLPEVMRKWVVIWPSFHLDQLALNLAGVEEFSFVSPALAAAVLVGVTVLFGGLAIRRLARVG